MKPRHSPTGPAPRRPRDPLGRPLPTGSRDRLGSHDEPADDRAALAIAIDLFDARRFFEAHEVFEWVWKDDATPDVDRGFWKALAQLAAGLCHCQRGNAKGAVAVLRRAVAGLEGYPAGHGGVDVSSLIRDARMVAEAVESRGTEGVELPRWPSR